MVTVWSWPRKSYAISDREVWLASCRAAHATMSASPGASSRAIAMSPDQRQFATCGNDNLVKLWNVADFALVRTFEGHTSHVYNVAFHPTERMIVSGDLRGNIKQWDLATGRETRTMDAVPVGPLLLRALGRQRRRRYDRALPRCVGVAPGRAASRRARWG